MEMSKEIILKVYEYDKNAFLLGCGKDTMMYKFKDITGIYYSKWELRREICKHFNPIYTDNQCTKFMIP